MQDCISKRLFGLSLLRRDREKVQTVSVQSDTRSSVQKENNLHVLDNYFLAALLFLVTTEFRSSYQTTSFNYRWGEKAICMMT